MYKPYFETYRNKSLLRSTPLSSLGLTSLRKPIDQTEVNEIFEMITTHPGPGSQFNQKSARDVLNSNAISKIAEIIQLIWAEQLGDDKDLSLTKKDLLSDAIQRVGQEISVVLKIEQEEAENMINKKLMKMTPKN